jgi:hypothetical protein
MKTLIFFILLVSNISLLSANELGTIISVQGKATKIDLKNKSPIKIEKDQQISNESSLLTFPKALLTIQLFDGSFIRLAEDSKVLIRFEKDQKKWIIYLDTGMAKFFFNKGNDAEMILIKTQNGEIQATSSKFVVSYNSLLHITSVLSEKGKIQFYSKKDPEEIETIEENEFSYLENDMDEPESGDEIDDKRKNEFLKNFSTLKNDNTDPK